MEIQQFLQALRRNWWIVVVMLLLSTGFALIFSFTQAPVYEATGKLVANPSLQVSNTDDLLYSLDTLSDRTTLVTTYCDILESQGIFLSAAAQLNLPADIIAEYVADKTLATYSVNCVVLPDSSVLQLTVQAPSAALATELAKTIGNLGIDYVKSLQGIYELRFLDAPAALPNPVSPDHLVNGTLGIAIGLLGGLAIIFLQQTLMGDVDDRSILVAHSTQRKLVASTTGAESHSFRPGTAKILVVDDSEEVTEMLEAQLMLEGYQVQVVGDGESALRVAQAWIPDLVLLDVKMPGMDGFEVARRMRKIEKIATVPIIMLTAKSSMAHKTVGFESGADDYITKPFEVDDLSLRIASHLRRVRMLGNGEMASNGDGGASTAVAVDSYPYTNSAVVKAFHKILEERGEKEYVNDYLMLAGLGHLAEPETSADPYAGPDIMTLPNLSDDIKADVLAELES
jgi:CheY-like chemotaxis protein/capsular polysaccharide biosynthesis protein